MSSSRIQTSTQASGLEGRCSDKRNLHCVSTRSNVASDLRVPNLPVNVVLRVSTLGISYTTGAFDFRAAGALLIVFGLFLGADASGSASSSFGGGAKSSSSSSFAGARLRFLPLGLGGGASSDRSPSIASVTIVCNIALDSTMVVVVVAMRELRRTECMIILRRSIEARASSLNDSLRVVIEEEEEEWCRW